MAESLIDKKILIIVESPNKVSTISQILKKAGYSKAVVMASVGHIMELANGGDYYNSGIDPNNDFELNLKVSADKYEVVNKLKTQAQAADLVYLMSDPDREGYVISWSLVKFLKLPKTKYRRAITHEITPKAVVNAIENPVPMDDNLVDAGLARLTLDKMVGFRLSPIAKTYIGAKSVGRCQSAGLKLIVEREQEIQNFKPEEYFDLYLHFAKNNAKFKAKYVGTDEAPIEHLKTKAEVALVKNACKNDYVIKNINKREKEEAPKPPFCTATFQQEVSSKLGLGVKDAMACAQKLFEGISLGGNHLALITYMRTDDTEMSPEFIPTLKAYIEKTYGKKSYVAPRKGKKQEGAQEGHECLRVIDPAMTPDLLAKHISNDLLLKVYRIIWQRTIAAALPNAKISETTYNIYNGKHKFALVSNELIDEGYRKVYNYKDDDDAEEENVLVKETFDKNEVLKNTKLEDVQKATKPKPRFTEATFIKELQKREIGRPSTYATIVETVLSPTRGYCTLDHKVIIPTERGIQLANFLDRAFSNIINLNYTKEMEKDLDKIAEGKMKKLDFLNGFYNDLEASINSNKELGTNNDETPSCPICGAPMIIRRSKFGKLFYGCSKYPTCRGLINVK